MLIQIDHLSPSHINTFITNRSRWFARYFRDAPYTSNLNVNRGHAVEAGIVEYLTSDHKNITKCIEVGMKKYNELLPGLKDDLEYRQSIGPLISTAISGTEKQSGYEFLNLKHGTPQTQAPIKVFLDGCSIPVTGYIDFLWKKCVYDNKVTKRNPDKLSQDYIVQGAIYHLATGLPVYFFYEVANKTPSLKEIKLSDENIEFGLKLATQAAKAIEIILDNPINGKLMEAFLFPDPDGGYGGQEQVDLCKFLGLNL